MPRRLHIVRHADVVVDPSTRAMDWTLSPDAKEDVVGLLRRFDTVSLRRIISSRETKARQTAGFLAEALGLTVEIREGLEEHHRRRQGFVSAAAFSATLREFFEKRKETVFGEESADMSLQRFYAAIKQVMGETSDDELVVSHGRIIRLFLASIQNGDPMDIWASLKLPDHVSLDWSNP